MTDILEYNRKAWDSQVEQGNSWTKPVAPEVTAAARRGEWQVLLTPQKFVPRTWFPDEMKGIDLLCLAGGGGQQGPVFSAAGANVTVLDNSPCQLAGDRFAAERDGLELRTIQGDMADLSVFADESYDLVFHPVSNIFVPDVKPVWREAYRVLRRGGALLAGFVLPLPYIFDMWLMDEGELKVKYKIPYSDQRDLPPEDLQRLVDDGSPFEFGHTLEDQLGGQTDAGFLITAFFEDHDPQSVLGQYIATFGATRAVKP